ncbi:MAG: hypothetical protein U5O39_18960 [Gammaproteobacteria bacterium]|nr:hypothetical protein [Gammaproteobacteria bacterium]
MTGLATLDANGGTSGITLGDNANDTTNFGSLDLTGSAVTVTEDSAVTLAGVMASSLDLTSNGAITQTGAVDVTTTATFDAGGTVVGTNDITLDNSANTLTTVAYYPRRQRRDR